MIIFFHLINIIKNMLFFTGSYSNNVFLEPLSKEEEEKYVKLMFEGNADARNKLIEHNLRLVAHIVKKFSANDNMTDDLISIGTIGLIKGIDTYKDNKKTKITTYAARCIQNEILMYFRANKKSNNDVSLSDSIGYDKEGNEINLIDVIEDKTPDMIENIFLKDNIKSLEKYLKLLNNRERDIIAKRYGLNGEDEKTQKQIAKDFHISRSYVSRIEKRALTKLLKEFIKEKKQ
ncbi:MAG: RNA polymerase sporulation sigma factor SigK [Bacilli bacterium]|nr:RNA polymerase sporulation sigma factor SigK [Bacilli bacterium]